MLLYIIRHGDPNYKTDSLTPKGILQAESVGKRMRHAGIDRIFSSPYGRAKQTAEPACRLLGLPCNIEPWAHEIEGERLTTYPDGVPASINLIQNTYLYENGAIDAGYYEAYSTPAVAQSNMKDACTYIWENGKDFLERLGYREENGIYRILQPSEEKVALFCHAAFAKAWISMLLHIPLHIMCGATTYCHTGVTILQFANNANGITAPRMLCYSDLSHLYKDGPDLVYNNQIDI